jgi:hypothetical protein
MEEIPTRALIGVAAAEVVIGGVGLHGDGDGGVVRNFQNGKMKPEDEAAVKNLSVDANELAYLELRRPLDEILLFKNFVGAAAKQGYLFHLLHQTLLQFPTDDAAAGGSCHTHICRLSHPSNLEFVLVCFIRLRGGHRRNRRERNQVSKI